MKRQGGWMMISSLFGNENDDGEYLIPMALLNRGLWVRNAWPTNVRAKHYRNILGSARTTRTDNKDRTKTSEVGTRHDKSENGAR